MVRFTEGRVLSFHVASGTSLNDCTAIITAVDEDRGFSADDVFEWLVEWFSGSDAGKSEFLGPKERIAYKSVWRAPDGNSFVIPRSHSGQLVQLRRGQRITHEFPFTITSVC